MPKFFTTDIDAQHAVISGEDVKHITKVLRLDTGDEVTLCDCAGYDYKGNIAHIERDQIIVNITHRAPCLTEPDISLTIYMALPKGDKMNLIVQKCVELGADKIVPVLTKRCVSRPDGKSAASKVDRWQKVAWEAAKQCGRGKLPTVSDVISFDAAVQEMAALDCGMLLYEKGGIPLQDCLDNAPKTIGIMVGSEGGFEEEEAAKAAAAGLHTVGLGKRILRCETAPIAAASVIMYLTDNLQ